VRRYSSTRFWKQEITEGGSQTFSSEQMSMDKRYQVSRYLSDTIARNLLNSSLRAELSESILASVHSRVRGMHSYGIDL
jgi:hypothetical protein